MSSDEAAVSATAKKRPKRPIKTMVNVHDRTQLETVFDYYLTRGLSVQGLPDAAARKGSLSYRVDAYLFYPRQFGLNEQTYPRERFFADVRPLLRFREPKFGHKAMLGSKLGATSPLVFLEQYLGAFESSTIVEPVANAVSEVRLFACAFVGSFVRSFGRSRRRLMRVVEGVQGDGRDELAKVCRRILRQIERADAVLCHYRGLLPRAAALPEPLIGELLNEFKLIDEYCYYRLRDAIALLWRVVPEEMPETAALRGRMASLLAAHDAYASQVGYMQPTPTSSLAVKERYLYRRGELKRRIWEVLFLELRTVPLFTIQRQLGAMIAAGAASIWALVAQYLLVRKAMEPQNLTDILGLSGLLFLSFGALAYIVKDRIKELGRTYVGGILRHVPDHSERLFYNNRQGHQEVVGSVQETARFIKPQTLPVAIRQRRREGSRQDLNMDDTGSRVLRYTKVIKLSRQLRILGRYPLRVVHDMLRINIDACLPRLGEPTRSLDMVSPTGEAQTVAFPKVYYLDLVLSYARLAKNAPVGEPSLDYFRLVLDKNGLLRVERMTG